MADDAPPRLTVISPGASFRELWDDLGERLGLDVRRTEAPEPVRASRSVAAVLVCAGREGRAVELLHDAQRVGLDALLVVGAEPDHRLAVTLMRRGAAAYYALPDDVEQLEEEIRSRVGQRDAGGQTTGDVGREAYDFSAIVGRDPELNAALERASRVISRGSATVLIQGETGTGKELLAQALHYNGPRAEEPFVPVNCSAIPGNLLESELFGHEKGAFTDARTAKPGLFEAADGGSLFLDEVATLPLELQAKLLRVLESGEVRRVGGVRSSQVDVRIIAAANVDLRERVAEGEFREDLYYRLAVVPIRLPPLRERSRDVRVLARHFVASLADEYGMEPPEIDPGAMERLERHPWPGNVRELRNAVERALLLSDGGTIRTPDLALEEAAPVPGGESGTGVLPFPATLEELEQAAVERMIELSDGNKSEAARRLGIPRSRLYRILKRGGPEGEGEDDGGAG